MAERLQLQPGMQRRLGLGKSQRSQRRHLTLPDAALPQPVLARRWSGTRA